MHRGRVVEQGPTARGARPPPRAVHAAAARERAAARMEADARRARPDPRNARVTCSLTLALVNGRVRTLDPDRPAATAIARRRRRSSRSATTPRSASAVSATTEVIDLDGAARVPGLIDSHLHPFLGAAERARRRPDGRRTRSRRSARRVAAERARCAPHEWVLGYGLDYNAFAGTGISGELDRRRGRRRPGDPDVHRTSTRRWRRRGRSSSRASTGRGRSRSTPRSCAWTARPTGELREMARHRARPRARCRSRRRAASATGCAEHAAAIRRRRHHRRARDGRRRSRRSTCCASSRRNGDCASRIVTPFWSSPRPVRTSSGLCAAHRDAHGAALARRRREVLHRRRDRVRYGVARASPTARATGSSRSGPTPSGIAAPSRYFARAASSA